MKNPPPGMFTLERERKPFWSNRGLAFLAFIVPLVILAITYAALQVFPFGSRHCLTVDLFHQYTPFFSLLRDKLLTGSSLFYASSIGLGTNFYALFAYYLASPLNLLFLLFPPAYLAEGVLIVSLLKIGLAGFSFYHYLRVSFRRRGALAIAFSSFYALSGFVLAYSWNIMWLDGLILLPLVLLALVRLIRDGKWLLYPLSLALLLVANYYVAFFACIFIALYYPILLLRYTRDRQFLKRLLVFGKTAVLTLIGTALPALVLYPAWTSLAITSASGDKLPAAVELAGRPLAYLGQLFPFLQPTVRSGSPNLYAGLPLLILLPLYFISSRVRLREKILNGLLVFFLVLSFDTNVLDFLWHGLHYPNQLPFRYSFVLILLLLTIAYDGLRSIRDFRSTEIGLLGLCLVFVIPLVAALEPDIKLAPWTQWGALAFMVLYTLLFSSFKSRKYKRRFQANVLLAVMLFELLLSTFSGLYFMDKNEYYGNRDGYSAGPTVQSIREAVAQVDKLDDGGYYRVETRPHKTSNDPALYGYRGLSLFASTSPSAPVTFFRNLGFYNNGINSYQYRGATLFSEALFDIKYLIQREKSQALETERRIVLGNDYVTVYENPYAFPPAFLADREALDFESSHGNPFRSQNDLAGALYGETLILFEDLRHDRVEGQGLTDPSAASARFSLTGSGLDYSVSWVSARTAPHYLYLDLRGLEVESARLVLDDGEITCDSSKRGIVEIGTVPEASSFTLSFTLKEAASEAGNFEARVASLDPNLLGILSERAREGGVTDFSLQEGSFRGKVTAGEEALLFITIPYDPGWRASLNGQPASIERVDDALMALRLEAGENEFSFNFTPVGFYEGLYLSLGALLALALIILWRLGLVLIRKRKEEGEGRVWRLSFRKADKGELPDPEEGEEAGEREEEAGGSTDPAGSVPQEP